MKKSIRFVVSLLLVFTLLFPSVAHVLAAEWNGSSADSSVGNVSGSTGGYAIKGGFANSDSSSPIPILGIRFSFYNVDTNATEGTTIDIFKSAYETEMGWNKFASKYNKPQLIELYKSWDWDAFKSKGFTTDTTNCYTEDDYDLIDYGLDGLPENVDDIASWQKGNANINAIVTAIGISDSNNDGKRTIADFGKGDYLLVEPLFPVKLNGIWYVLTVTEMAILGTDADFNSVDSSYDGTVGVSKDENGEYSDDGTWRWINNFTNRRFPNSLFLDKSWVNSEGNAVLASECITDSTYRDTTTSPSRYTFDFIIHNGLGIGIAWTNPTATADSSYTVNHYIMSTDGEYPATATYSVSKNGTAGTALTLSGLALTDSAHLSPYHKYDYGTVGGKTVTETTIASDGSTVINLYYTLKSYTIEYNGNGHTDGSTESSKHYFGVAKELTPNGYARTGYTFVGWNTKEDGTGDSYADKASVTNLTTTDGATITLYAQWKTADTSYKVNHYIMGLDGKYPSTPDSTDTYNAAAGDILDEQTLVDYCSNHYNGFTFSHALANGETFTEVAVADDGSTTIDLYYSRNKYTVSLSKGTGIESVTGAGEYYYGESVTINATVSEGYIWSKWTGSHTTTTQEYTFTITKDITDSANATPITYTIEYVGNGHTDGSTASSTHTYNVEKALTANGYSKTGYAFVGWNTKEDGTGDSYTNEQLVKNLTTTNGATITLYAQWETADTSYTINHYRMNTSGTYPTTPYTTENLNGTSGSMLTLADLAKSYTGFTYDHGKVGGNTVTTVTIADDGSTVINLYYSRNKYTVTLNVGDGIDSVTGAGEYYYGESVTINATVSEGYTWSKWTGNLATSTQKYVFLMPATNVSNTATATENDVIMYTVNHYQMNTSGDYDFFMSSTYDTEPGKVITLATHQWAFDGYKYSHGTVGGNTVTTVTIADDGSTVINLYYDRLKYTVDLIAGDGIDSVSGEGDYYWGESVTINATVSEGYIWSKWDGTLTTITQEYTFTMPKLDITATATAIGESDALYTINHYAMNSDGTYNTAPTYSESKYAPPGAVLTLADLVLSGFPTSNHFFHYGTVDGTTATSATIAEDGSTVINLYYAYSPAVTTVSYYVMHYQQQEDGTYSLVERESYTGLAGDVLTVASLTNTYKGYAYSHAELMNGTAITGDTITLSSNMPPIQLYYDRVSYTIEYDGNGHTDGSTASSTHTYNVEKALTANGYSKTGYTFIGWNTKEDGTGDSYTNEQIVKNLTTTNGATITLYAQWEAEPTPEDICVYVDYVGNGATSGAGWTETVNISNTSVYTLSSAADSFSRIEENAGGSTTAFKFVGWEINGVFYDFAAEISVEDLEAEAESVAGREYNVVTVKAYWDEYPVINAVDRWFSLDEAINGDITFEELMKTADAIDGEIGDETDFVGGEGEFTIIDYAEDEFKKFTTTGSVTVTYVAVDKAGNKVKVIVTVHIVDKEQYAPGTIDNHTRYVRYISGKYYKQADGEFVEEENGGVNKNSVWRIFYEYEKLLVDTFNNKQDPETGEWETVYQTWVITTEQVAEVKAFVEEYGLGKTRNEDALRLFYKKFYLGVSE